MSIYIHKHVNKKKQKKISCGKTNAKIINKVIEKYKSHFYWLALGLSFSSIASMFYNPEIVGYYNGWSTNGVNTIELSIGIVLFCLGFAGIFIFCLFTSKKEKANQITQKEEIQE